MLGPFQPTVDDEFVLSTEQLSDSERVMDVLETRLRQCRPKCIRCSQAECSFEGRGWLPFVSLDPLMCVDDGTVTIETNEQSETVCRYELSIVKFAVVIWIWAVLAALFPVVVPSAPVAMYVGGAVFASLVVVPACKHVTRKRFREMLRDVRQTLQTDQNSS